MNNLNNTGVSFVTVLEDEKILWQSLIVTFMFYIISVLVYSCNVDNIIACFNLALTTVLVISNILVVAKDLILKTSRQDIDEIICAIKDETCVQWEKRSGRKNKYMKEEPYEQEVCSLQICNVRLQR